MSAPLVKLDDESQSRSVMFPDWLWARLGEAAQTLSEEIRVPVTISDLVRQGAAQRVQDVLGKDALQ